MDNTYILGSGKHAKSIASLSKLIGLQIQHCYFGNLAECNSHFIDIESLPILSNLIIGIGDNYLREELYNKYSNRNNLINMIITSDIMDDVTIGKGNYIALKSYIGPCVFIGDNNIINTSSILEHDVKIGNSCHISVSSVLCGSVEIGDRVFVGANATIIDGVTITNDVVIGAGSTVIKNIEEPGVYVGNPTVKIKS
ncbi:hypothetical protein CCZ37_12405 [Vibrio qinghaiensis]|uniref:Acetyltransferase n=1 Tax=Vibrio qinghaiensis TaxID=2025808 RepID=A0A223N0F6_9VIBR|nr:DapH/DapD/GlmU-related protein [Vibrio qinghaiensis]ASU23342.1 hypothetical protein CCZ37_12405 [Vibrio qinghaiensis]